MYYLLLFAVGWCCWLYVVDVCGCLWFVAVAVVRRCPLLLLSLCVAACCFVGVVSYCALCVAVACKLVVLSAVVVCCNNVLLYLVNAMLMSFVRCANLLVWLLVVIICMFLFAVVRCGC